jgi:hypothetical protein
MLPLEEREKITITATEGMYINLNDGKIWSKNFELNAGSLTEGAVILNNTPATITDYYFYVGKSNGDHISYDG